MYYMYMYSLRYMSCKKYQIKFKERRSAGSDVTVGSREARGLESLIFRQLLT